MIDQWWTIHGEELMEMLLRVQNGEDAVLVYTEHYANSVIEHPADEGE